MPQKKYMIYLFALLFLLGLSLTGIYLRNQKKQSALKNQSEVSKDQNLKEDTLSKSPHQAFIISPKLVQEMGLTIKKAASHVLHITLSTRGKIVIQPDHLAHIIPKVSGVAREIYKNIGDDVTQGEIMAELESRDMADIKAMYLAALSKNRLAKASLNREERLFKEKVSAEQDLLNAQNIYEESLINAQLAKQKLNAFGLNNEEIENLTRQSEPDLSLYYVKSPFAGTVIMRHITLGEFVENTKTIFEIADLSTVWVEIGIYPKDLHKVQEGQEVEIVIPADNQSAKAFISYVSPIIEDETITTKAIAQLKNPQNQWRPGVFVNVNIAAEEFTPSVAVPLEAIQKINGSDVVFVNTAKGIEIRPVKLGLSDKTYAEILSGIQVGEEYVADQTFLVKAEIEKVNRSHHD